MSFEPDRVIRTLSLVLAWTALLNISRPTSCVAECSIVIHERALDLDHDGICETFEVRGDARLEEAATLDLFTRSAKPKERLLHANRVLGRAMHPEVDVPCRADEPVSREGVRSNQQELNLRVGKCRQYVAKVGVQHPTFPGWPTQAESAPRPVRFAGRESAPRGREVDRPRRRANALLLARCDCP